MQSKMKSFTLFVALLCLFSTNLLAQDIAEITKKAATPEGPMTTIEFEETTYDFGFIETGGIVSKVFTFTNTGDEPLVITNAKGSCGCTVPEWPQEPIMPGETASLTVEFDSKNKSGKQSKRVTITANTEPAQTFLTIKGELTPKTDASEVAVETPEVVSPDCFAIFPNPTAEILKLDVDDANLGQSAAVSIYSKSGQLMAQRDIDTLDGIIEFSVGHYPNGTYLASLQIGDRKPETRCFVVTD